MKLRPYQTQLVQDIQSAWASGHNVVLARLPTAGGKTPTFAACIVAEPGPSVVIAHRANLVAQASLTLARYGIRHRVIGPKTLQRACVSLHMRRLNRSFIDPSARCAVATVATLAGLPENDPFLLSVRLWIVDEGHHLLRDNVWGKAVARMPNARGLPVTATPGRPDGKGLGRKADGLADVMVEGPELQDLTSMGYITPYRVYAPPSDIDLSNVPVGASGEFVADALAQVFHASRQIVGDVVGHYVRLTPGKLGMTFAVDIEEAGKIAAAFREAGVPAEVLTGDTDPLVRDQIMRKFEARQILQLISVDLLGEGTDIPAVEVVSMARPTNSFILFAQQLGRVIRLLLGDGWAAIWDDLSDEQRREAIATGPKPYGVLIDHVGNVFRHGLPNGPRPWTLERRERASKGKKSDAIPVRNCLNEACTLVYERVLVCCPYCGHEPPAPAARSTPDQVDGDLILLDPAAMALLGKEQARVDGPARIPQSLEGVAQMAVRKRHHERQEAQQTLRHHMALWGGYWHAKGTSDRESQRRFFHQFKHDVLTAQILGTPDAQALTASIVEDLQRKGVAL